MKCINKFAFILIFVLMASQITGCSKNSSEFMMPFSDYQKTMTIQSSVITGEKDVVNTFSKDLCVFTGDKEDIYKLDKSGNAGLLINLNSSEVLFSENAFEQFYPASITKVMTAYVALKYGNLDDTITCTSEVSEIKVNNAVLLGLHKGDKLTLDQALHLALLSSYNDVAVAIAIHIGGSIEGFAELMNKEALALGATYTHFENPHGLDGVSHKTTAYDLYLIFNEAIKNPTFLEIIQCKEYRTTYKNSKGKDVTAISLNTNQYFRGIYTIPESVTLVGGKTGTTTEAGNCLMLLVRDKYSNPYISIILGADSKDDLYVQMSDLLTKLTN